jgi:hypothetical protein
MDMSENCKIFVKVQSTTYENPCNHSQQFDLNDDVLE